MKVFRGKLESACLSIHVSVSQSICVQNTSVCQSAGVAITSHLVTALVDNVFYPSRDRFHFFFGHINCFVICKWFQFRKGRTLQNFLLD